jgi:Zn-dependent protease
VHGERLAVLASEAESKRAEGDLTAALVAWRGALDLLPPESRQHVDVQGRIDGLSRELEAGGVKPAAPERPAWARRAGPFGVLGLLLWKIKFALVFFLSKAKLLLLGLTKMSTVLSMLLSFGVYWTAWGWRFALGLVVSIYIHEMGHVAALSRLGIKATAPMFIPGFGALVRLKQYPASPREDARVGLAGPLWGLGAALAAYAAFAVTAVPSLGAISQWGARINLFNLLPIGSLDGGRGFRALSRLQRVAVVVLAAAVAVLTGEQWLWIISIVGAVRIFGEPGPVLGDSGALVDFVLLLSVLGTLTRIAQPVLR